jgi:hypothetical protein
MFRSEVGHNNWLTCSPMSFQAALDQVPEENKYQISYLFQIASVTESLPTAMNRNLETDEVRLARNYKVPSLLAFRYVYNWNFIPIALFHCAKNYKNTYILYISTVAHVSLIRCSFICGASGVTQTRRNQRSSTFLDKCLVQWCEH